MVQILLNQLLCRHFLTPNTSYEEIAELESSYLRDGRVHQRFVLGEGGEELLEE